MSVHFSGYANSTKFTDCCDTAICDSEKYCPHCKAEIFPSTSRGRHDEAMVKLYGREKLSKIRASYKGRT